MPTDCYGGMTFKWGDYEHVQGECYPAMVEARPIISDHGVRYATRYRVEVKGDLLARPGEPELNPVEINKRIDEFQKEYIEDYKDAGFFFSDGTPTQHNMINDAPLNLSGNRIVLRSWDNGDRPNEYANTRSFSITVESVFQTQEYEILEYHEKVQKIGTGGPIFTTYNTWQGAPVREQITDFSKVQHIQEGYVVGANGYPPAPLPYWPLEELQEQRKLTYTQPRFFGDPQFRKGIYYRLDYRYTFERPGPSALTPGQWQTFQQ